ncbi:MAG: hypothetical protein EP338_13320 [Bacteroidetes bacterium]|nr:MAG: hypothetical protein EP338_13320 [Bacteroidota bacterium]
MDDPDEHVFEHVRGQLKSYGRDAIPYLEGSWEKNEFGLLHQSRIEDLIHEIQFDTCKEELRSWRTSSSKDLLDASIIIAKYQYPDLDVQGIRDEIERIRQAVWLEINEHQTAFEKIKVFNKVFYEMCGFRGNTRSFHSPLSSYVNTVLETRRGTPLTLSLIYSVIAQSLKIPVFGVNLPNHFVLCYMDENQTQRLLDNENKFGVLFYINTFSRGKIFYENDVTQFLRKLQITPDRSHFEPCSNTIMIQRMLTNLITAFQHVGNLRKVNELNELRSLFSD